MKRISQLSVAVVAALSIVGCVNRDQQKQAKKTEEILSDTTQPVTVMPVATTSLKDVLNITGTITTSEDVQVSAKNPGRLVAVYVKDGDPVSAGQLLASQETVDLDSRLRQAAAQVSSAQSAVSQAVANMKQGPLKSAASVKAAQAQLASAKALLAKAKSGPREEERKQGEAKVNAAKSNMDTAKADLDRKRSLFEEGAVSRQALDQAENAYQNALSLFQQALEQQRMIQNWTRPEDMEVAQEAVNSAQQQLAQAQANQKLDAIFKDQLDASRSNLKSAMAAQDLARQALTDAQVKAPFAGVVYGKAVQPGTFVAPGTPIVRLVGKGGVYFEGQIPESSIDKVDVGHSVAVRLSSLPNKTITGKIVAISPSGDNIGRQFNARIMLTGSIEGVKPGMFAEGIVELQNFANKTVVPSEAIVKSGDKTYVFTVSGNRAKKVEVKTGIQNGNQIEVQGLKVGDKVVVKGQSQLVDGAAVKVEANKSAEKSGQSSKEAGI